MDKLIQRIYSRAYDARTVDEALDVVTDLVREAFEGHTLVPDEPTPDMLDEICWNDGISYRALTVRYKAMLNAAQGGDNSE